MAAGRTGTTKWKHLRATVLRQAQRDGLEHCPECGIRLDYTSRNRPRNLAEVDHIKPVAQGGTDERHNLRVICRRCNQSLGAKQQKRQKNKHKPAPTLTLKTSRNW